MKSEAAFEVRERVRWADVDMAGIIYFGAYMRFVEIAESEYFRSLGFTYERFRELGILLPRVHLDIDFFKPALLDDVLRLQTRLVWVGVHSVRLKIDVLRDAGAEPVKLAAVTLVVSCVDGSHVSTPLPDPLARALRAQLVGACAPDT